MRGVVGVVSAVRVSPDIAHPDVKPSVRENECKALVHKVGEPVGGGAEEAVLEEEDGEGRVRFWRNRRKRKERRG